LAAYLLLSQHAALWLQGPGDDADTEKPAALSHWGQSPVLLSPSDALSPPNSVHGNRLFASASNDVQEDTSVDKSMTAPPATLMGTLGEGIPPANLMGTLGEDCMLLSQPETPGALGVGCKRCERPPS
jgi:hypothetical protein